MKNTIAGLVIGVAVVLLIGAAANVRFPLYGPFLQSDLDGAQLNITNLNSATLSELFIVTNSLSAWPTQANFPGQATFVNSNGTVYLLTSGPASSAWAATNKLAP